MSMVFAVFTSDPNLVRCELFRLQDEVSTSDPSANAVGLGSYAQDEVLFQRFPSCVDLKSASRLWPARESEAVLYHACKLPLGASPDENTQPFRYRRWMFCDVGMAEHARVNARLLSLLPDFLKRQIRGNTGSELVFALFLKLVRDAGRLDDPRIQPALAAQLLGRTARLTIEASSEAGAPRTGTLNCIATNGSVLVATRCGGDPLFYSLLEGSARCERCGIDASTLETLPLVSAHRRRRTVVIASHPTRPANWIEIPDGAAIAIGRDLNLQRLPI